MLDAMGLGEPPGARGQGSSLAAAALREAQDADYHAGLAADQAGAAAIVMVADRDDEGKMEEDDVHSDGDDATPASPPPLTTAQLRAARLAFYQPHMQS